MYMYLFMHIFISYSFIYIYIPRNKLISIYLLMNVPIWLTIFILSLSPNVLAFTFLMPPGNLLVRLALLACIQGWWATELDWFWLDYGGCILTIRATGLQTLHNSLNVGPWVTMVLVVDTYLVKEKMETHTTRPLACAKDLSALGRSKLLFNHEPGFIRSNVNTISKSM